jgi:hypothetical protein
MMSLRAPDGALPPDASPDASRPVPSLAAARARLDLSRLLGRISACIFLLAAIAVLDALQTLVRHEFNSIDLVPGESVPLSGMLPAGAKNHGELDLRIEGAPGIRLVPRETYKGFWMGGQMWRADLSADSGMAPGEGVVTVVDIIPPATEQGKGEKNDFDDRDRSLLFGGRQNPALVFTVTVWPTESARRAADSSLFRRLTGLPAFGVAVVAVLLAIAAGIGNWLAFGKAEAGLAAHGVFFIHGLQDLRPKGGTNAGKSGPPGLAGYRAAFARAGEKLAPGDPVLLCDRAWNERGRGRIVEVDALKAYALFPRDGVRPRYGWLVTREKAEKC